MLALSQADRAYLVRAFLIARDRAPAAVVSDEGFEFLRRAFLLAPPAGLEKHKEQWLDFLLRWQQFTGAVMAKGLEDTAFFVHHGLISLNEVGCNPLRKEIRFGVAAFHQHNKKTFLRTPVYAECDFDARHQMERRRSRADQCAVGDSRRNGKRGSRGGAS